MGRGAWPSHKVISRSVRIERLCIYTSSHLKIGGLCLRTRVVHVADILRLVLACTCEWKASQVAGTAVITCAVCAVQPTKGAAGLVATFEAIGPKPESQHVCCGRGVGMCRLQRLGFLKASAFVETHQCMGVLSCHALLVHSSGMNISPKMKSTTSVRRLSDENTSKHLELPDWLIGRYRDLVSRHLVLFVGVSRPKPLSQKLQTRLWARHNDGYEVGELHHPLKGGGGAEGGGGGGGRGCSMSTKHREV